MAKLVTMVTLVMPFARLARMSAIITLRCKAEVSLTLLVGILVLCLPSTRRRVEHVEVKLDTLGDPKIWSRTWA